MMAKSTKDKNKEQEEKGKLASGVDITSSNGNKSFGPIADDLIPDTKKPLLMFSIFVAVMLLLGSVAWWHETNNSPKSIFNDMLSNSTSLSGYSWEYELTSGSTIMKSNFDADSSNPSHFKSKITTELKDEEQDIDVKYKGVVDDDVAYVFFDKYRIPKSISGDYNTDAVVGSWIKTTRSEQNALRKLDVSAFATLFALSQPAGEIPVGNFTGEQQRELLRYMKAGSVYSLGNIHKAEFEGEAGYSYEIKLNTDKLLELNKKIKEYTGEEFTISDRQYYRQAAQGKYEVFINKETRQLRLISIIPADSDGDYQIEIEVYNHNKPVKIEVPSSGALSPNEFLRLISNTAI